MSGFRLISIMYRERIRSKKSNKKDLKDKIQNERTSHRAVKPKGDALNKPRSIRTTHTHQRPRSGSLDILSARLVCKNCDLLYSVYGKSIPPLESNGRSTFNPKHFCSGECHHSFMLRLQDTIDKTDSKRPLHRPSSNPCHSAGVGLCIPRTLRQKEHIVTDWNNVLTASLIQYAAVYPHSAGLSAACNLDTSDRKTSAVDPHLTRVKDYP